jgi:hypothetical protein
MQLTYMLHMLRMPQEMIARAMLRATVLIQFCTSCSAAAVDAMLPAADDIGQHTQLHRME